MKTETGGRVSWAYRFRIDAKSSTANGELYEMLSTKPALNIKILLCIIANLIRCTDLRPYHDANKFRVATNLDINQIVEPCLIH
jgi:hypothetical protein